jgi:hypothetical protein
MHYGESDRHKKTTRQNLTQRRAPNIRQQQRRYSTGSDPTALSSNSLRVRTVPRRGTGVKTAISVHERISSWQHFFLALL